MAKVERDKLDIQLELRGGFWYYDKDPAPQVGVVPDEEACFGLSWDAPHEEMCQECVYRFKCFDDFANRVGTPHADDIDAMAAELGSSADAIRAAMRGGADPLLIPVPDEPLKKRRRSPKKANKPVKDLVAENPTQARSVTNVMDRASTREVTLKTARFVQGPDGTYGTRQINRQTFAERFMRERQRVPMISRLTPGTTITVEYPVRSGRFHTLRVMTGFYSVLPHGNRSPVPVPTLYEAAKEVVGLRLHRVKNPDGTERLRVGLSWSGPQFWRIRRELRRLDRQKKHQALLRARGWLP
jgi:hypothetical protein